MLGNVFDPHAELAIREHYRPHWSQAGGIVFITIRTQDSIPKEVILRWEREKQAWMDRLGQPTSRHWSQSLPTLNEKERRRFLKAFDRQREVFLDTCQGRCVLKSAAAARIVYDALLHFDGQRYRMGDFVVMPNHAHLLAAFPSAALMGEQCDSWLHFSAREINQLLGEKGKFWQQEPFDHLVRSDVQYAYLREYIANNGPKAGLLPSEYLHRRFAG